MAGAHRRFTWLHRIGGRAQIIAIASLVLLGGQAAILVYGLNRGVTILTDVLVRAGEATEAVDGLATDVGTVGGSLVRVMADLHAPSDIGRFVPDRAAAIAADWPETKRSIEGFIDPASVERADEALQLLPGFVERLRGALTDGDEVVLAQLHDEWMDLSGPLVKLINRARARVIEHSNAARHDATELRRWVEIAVAATLALGLLVLGTTWYVLTFAIARPVKAIARTMTTLAGGQLDAPIPSRDRRDEIGEMAGAIEVFRAHAVERDALLAERDETAARLERLVAERTAELERRSGLLADTFGHMQQGICMVDADLRIVVHNRRFAELWNLTPEFLKAHPELPFLARFTAERGDFFPRSPEDVVAERLHAFKTGQPFRDEARLAHGPVIEIHGVPRPEGGYVVTYSDVTLRAEAAAATERAREAAESANAAKSTFLATMTHELRTPMNGVLGMLELLRQTETTREQRDLVDVIAGSAEALLKIIDDILDLSKIEAGRMEVERLPVSPLALVEAVADTLAHQAHRKRLHLDVLVDPDLPPAFLGDPIRLRQILFNLVGNAIKFTEAGSVGIEASAEYGDVGRLTLVLSVHDTGIGLTEEECGRLFTAFSQADASTTRRFGGTGLGLSICKRLVELMGGTIGVDSVPGQGSTFWVRLPTTAALPPARPSEDDITGVRVRIVGDDAAAQCTLANHLVAAGALVETTASINGAAEGYDAVIVAARDKDPAAVADAHVLGRRGILVIVSGDPSQRREAQTLGFAAAISKPIRRSTALGAVATAAGRRKPVVDEAVVMTAPSRTKVPRHPHRILVAEDHPTNQIVIMAQLNGLGYSAEVVGDGRLAQAAVEDGMFDILITDCHMPEMDGFELASAIRSRERDTGRARLPIVALTANALRGEAERCLAAGMDDYLSKPVTLARLDEVLRRWLPRIERPAIDLAQLREMVGDQDHEIRRMLGIFVQSIEPHLTLLSDAFVTRNDDDALRASHTAIGAARTAMANELADLLGEIEEKIRATDWTAAAASFARVGPAVGRVRAFISEQ